MDSRPNYMHFWISGVEEITLESVHPDEEQPDYGIWIKVRTARGDMFDLLLQASKKQNLKFRKELVVDPPF